MYRVFWDIVSQLLPFSVYIVAFNLAWNDISFVGLTILILGHLYLLSSYGRRIFQNFQRRLGKEKSVLNRENERLSMQHPSENLGSDAKYQYRETTIDKGNGNPLTSKIENDIKSSSHGKSLVDIKIITDESSLKSHGGNSAQFLSSTSLEVSNHGTPQSRSLDLGRLSPSVSYSFRRG